MKKSNIGGQGVLEGVMMRAPSVCGLAVRRTTGEIVYEKECVTSATKKNKFYGFPVVRGVVSFIDMMAYGVKTITKSAKLFDDTAQDYKPSKFESFIAKKTGKEIMDVAIVFAVVLSVALAIGIFFILPSILVNILRPYIASPIIMNLVEGGVRMLIFFIYVMLITFLKEIKRVFMYHGAEHKTINCYEHEEELTVENVQKFKTLHPRCGTSYLLLVMVISILLFSLLGWSPSWYARIGLRLLMLPVVAGVAYEFLKFAARGESMFFRIIRWPGMMLQKLTTAEPEDSMVEVAIVAFVAAMDELDEAALCDLAKSFLRPTTNKDNTKENQKSEPQQAQG
ncbi:MAG: DUF1385 domain-containing protein [Christensenellales bacterium]|jgi:uncharacterized protein YqhQ